MSCEWSVYDENGMFFTSCDNAFQFESGGVEDNGFNYCPYCGKAIEATNDIRSE